ASLPLPVFQKAIRDASLSIGSIFEWTWGIVSAPAGSTAVLVVDPAVPDKAEIVPDAPGVYVIALDVLAGGGMTDHVQADLEAVIAPTGIEVTMKWDGSADLDLHLVDVSNGGTLWDLALDCHFRNCLAGSPPLDWGQPG